MNIYVILTVAATLAALIFIFFQRKSNTDNSDESILSFTDQCFNDSSHSNSSIKISYPMINQLEYRKINQLIEDYIDKIAESEYGKSYQNLTMTLSYKIPFSNNKLLSIVFEGVGNQKNSAYLNNLIFALNINLEDESVITLSDLYYITADSVDIIKKSFSNSFIPKKLEEWGVTKNSESYDRYLNQIKNISPSNIEDALLNQNKFYLSEKSLVICTAIPHTIGDYFETETEYSKLTEFAKINKKPFV